MNLPRLRILRHKDTWKCHYTKCLLVQPSWPIVKYISIKDYKTPEDHFLELLGAKSQSGLDLVIEHYREDGSCIHPPITSVDFNI